MYASRFVPQIVTNCAMIDSGHVSTHGYSANRCRLTPFSSESDHSVRKLVKKIERVYHRATHIPSSITYTRWLSTRRTPVLSHALALINKKQEAQDNEQSFLFLKPRKYCSFLNIDNWLDKLNLWELGYQRNYQPHRLSINVKLYYAHLWLVMWTVLERALCIRWDDNQFTLHVQYSPLDHNGRT